MTTYVIRDGKLVPKHLAPPKLTEMRRLQGVISDSMGETWHPCDGRYYDSKSTFRAVTRAHGGYEVGNDSAASSRSEDRSLKSDIAGTFAELGG